MSVDPASTSAKDGLGVAGDVAHAIELQPELLSHGVCYYGQKQYTLDGYIFYVKKRAAALDKENGMLPIIHATVAFL